jgi:hypothetical protein
LRNRPVCVVPSHSIPVVQVTCCNKAELIPFLPDKLTVAQLLRNTEAHYRVHNGPYPLTLFLSELF